ncbi:MAG TPA: hypothetical protein VMB47_14400 [Candidatus Aquilonibacter sp.]|nr:hypothetical protein [Candidatus Aquilonibacter sp.]
MPEKKIRAKSVAIASRRVESRPRSSAAVAFPVISGNGKARGAMSSKSATSGNRYLCALERNQNGKYTVRVRVVYGRDGWALPAYFLASSFNAAMKKLEEALQHLQRNEERLRFWAVERTDDPNLAGDLLQEFGLWVDRRKEFPRRLAELAVPSERPVPAATLASVRRLLADSVAQERSATALAGD